MDNEVVVEDGKEVAVVDGWRRLGVLASWQSQNRN